jgi:hypothetical protein
MTFMKRFLLPVLIAVLFTGVDSTHAQEFSRHCGHDDLLKFAQQELPGFDAQYNRIYDQARAWALANADRQTEDTTYTIQLVFHILYEADDQYQQISDELIHSQIAALNRDFNKQNADTSDTREFFKPVAADTRIKFVLAKKIGDQCKDAIIRKQWTAPAAVLPIYGDFLIKDNLWGGSSAWNTAKYLNIWVCDLNKSSQPGDGFLGGYAYLPGLVNAGLPIPKRYDGVVIDFRFFGEDNPWVAEVQPGFGRYTKGRTTVHEVGHWLGLRHIWGDLGTLLPDQGCQADDGVDDTPNAAQPYAAHGFCQDTIVNSCDDGEGDLPDMFENYMDYSTDECNTMFTIGQSDVMRFVLSDYRAGTQFEYDYPSSSSIEADLDEMTTLEISYELEECFGFSAVSQKFNGTLTEYTSPLGSAVFAENETGIIYEAGTYDANNIDAFSIVVYDHHHNQYDTIYLEVEINDVEDQVTGIELVASDKNAIALYPNPTSSLFRVDFNGYQAGTEVGIYNTLGDLVLHRSIHAGVRSESFDLAGYPAGAYMIRFESDGEVTFEKVLVE